MIRAAATLLVVGLSGSSIAAAPVPPADPFTLTIRPIVGRDGDVALIEVTERLEPDTDDGKALSFRAALSAATVMHIAESIGGLSFTDAAGPVPFTSADDTSPGDFFAYRHWRLDRRAIGPVVVHYRIPVQNGPLRGGPPFGIASAGHGVAGSGFAFLLLPENLKADRTRVRWDLSTMAPGSIGTFTSGEGDAIITGPPRDIAGQWMLAGPAYASARADSVGFHGYVLGAPPFRPAELAAFGRSAYDVLTKHLVWAGSPDYRLMVRVRDGKSFTTGTAGLDHAAGALVTTGTEYFDGQDYDHVQTTVFHEMTHYWVGELADGGNWFSEGLTVFLTATLPCETKVLGPGTCAASINDFLANYYTSTGRDWSQSRIEASGFAVESVRRVPYARGALYFAELNGLISKRSHGRRTLIDALRPLMEARARGVPITVTRFEQLLRHELGPGAVAEFRSKVVDGTSAIEPPSSAFGPYLQRVPKLYRNTETGQTVKGFEWRPDVSPSNGVGRRFRKRP